MEEVLRYKDRDLKLHKSLSSPDFNNRTVLTNDPWDFVRLWLTREGHTEALFYWNQAREFSQAAKGLSLQSSPLLQYYCFMNASKALLSSKGIAFNPYHGVMEHKITPPPRKKDLVNIAIKIRPRGVLVDLYRYLGETESSLIHTLKDMFFNMPFVHRTYCLTYRDQTDMYIPLTECVYVINTINNEVRLRAKLSKDFVGTKYSRRLPASLIIDSSDSSGFTVKSANFVTVSDIRLSSLDLNLISGLNSEIRKDIQYIAGNNTLWYAKGTVGKGNKLDRTPLVLALASMHRLSEMSRYHPLELTSLLKGDKNWLISEFMTMSPPQFIDQISSEITGYQFLLPNVRTAT